MDEVEHNLLDYCVDYLQKKGLWDDVDGILEVLNHIPSGYTRFILYERVFELKKSQQADQPGHIPRDQ